MSTIYPLTLLYDASCPVCALEMDHLRSRNRAGRLAFVDMSEPGFDPAVYGATLQELNAEIHAQCADGRVIHGVQVLRLAYEAVGLGSMVRWVEWAPLRAPSERAYRLFARHRQTISRLAAPLIEAVRHRRARRMAKRMSECAGGACDVEPHNRSES